MTIQFKTNETSEPESITLPFLAPLESPKDARAMIVKMANEASAGLGIEIKRD